LRQDVLNRAKHAHFVSKIRRTLSKNQNPIDSMKDLWQSYRNSQILLNFL